MPHYAYQPHYAYCFIMPTSSLITVPSHLSIVNFALKKARNLHYVPSGQVKCGMTGKGLQCDPDLVKHKHHTTWSIFETYTTSIFTSDASHMMLCTIENMMSVWNIISTYLDLPCIFTSRKLLLVSSFTNGPHSSAPHVWHHILIQWLTCTHMHPFRNPPASLCFSSTDTHRKCFVKPALNYCRYLLATDKEDIVD